MSQITISLTVDETNAVLVALSKFPFEQVAGLIDNLQKQAGPQVAAIQEAEAKAAEAETVVAE